MCLRSKNLILVGLFVLFASSCLIFKPSAKKMTRRAKAAHSQYDAIIVPGIQFKEPAWDRVLQMRLIWAKHLYDRGLTKNIITSGSAVYSPYVEAEIMKEYLVAMGVPKENVIIESRAEHSTENLWYGYKLAQKNGFKSIALASDPFQSKMLYRFARKRLHKQVFFLPVIIDTLRGLPHDTPMINYEPLRLKNFVPITEKLSKRERFRGTMGRNIDFKEKD